MDKNDNVQTSTGESSVTNSQSVATTGSDTQTSANASTPSTALGNPGFLQNVQQRLESMGDEMVSLLAGRYIILNELNN